jgi:transmembrane 9 superfamily protein 2/4
LCNATHYSFVLSAPLAGYTSTRVYKMFKLTQWKRNAFHTAIFFTGVLATAIFMLKNVFVG